MSAKPAPTKPKSLFRGVILPSGFVGGAMLLVALFFSTFLTAHAWLLGGAVAGIVLFTASRVLRHFERPPVWGAAAGLALMGASGGALALGLLNAMFSGGPGWPFTPWWVFGAGLGIGLQRAWRPVHAAKKDAPALAILLGGLLLTGAGGVALFRALAPGGVGAQRMLVLGATVYALHGARLLLRFAADEREGKPGFVGWLRANALQNAVLVILLVGYLAFRDTLAATVPYFALVEFGLAVAVFGFVLQRLRARLKREESELASASLARQHERVVAELREHEYDAVARPVALFVETGRGAHDYAAAVASSALLEPAQAEATLEPVRAHREAPILPPLPLEWALLSLGVTSLGFALSSAALVTKAFEAPASIAAAIGFAIVAAGAYAGQDQLRARLLAWPAVGLAGAATVALLLDVYFWMARGSLPTFITWLLLAGAAAMVGASALSSWRLVRRIQRGEPVGAKESAGLLLDKQAQTARGRVTYILVGLLVLILPVRLLGRWLAGRGWIPDLIPVIFDDVLGIGVWAAIGLAASAAIRYWGLTRNKPSVVADEQARRARRLAIHTTIMRSIERT